MLRLVIRYRNVEEGPFADIIEQDCYTNVYMTEVRDCLEQALASMVPLSMTGQTQLRRFIWQMLEDRGTWLQSYLLDGHLAELVTATARGKLDEIIVSFIEVSMSESNFGQIHKVKPDLIACGFGRSRSTTLEKS